MLERDVDNHSSGFAAVRVTRAQRDALRRLAVDLEIGDDAIGGFRLDPTDGGGQAARRVRMETAFALLDDLGWRSADLRDAFEINARSSWALVDTLEQWRDWEAQALEDARLERRAGASVIAVSDRLLATAENLAAIGAVLAQVVSRES